MSTVSDRESERKIIALRKKHALSFVQNPGGGEFMVDAGASRRLHTGEPFYGVGFRCQVPLMDADEDYQIIITWLRKLGLEPPA